MDCPRSHGKAVDCAARTGVGRGRAAPSPPAHSLSTGPQGAPALRACPQASHNLGRWLETASRSPHFLLPSSSISSIMSRHLAGPRRALRCGSRFVHWFLKAFPPPGGPGKWGADQGRDYPDLPAEILFSDLEIKVLQAVAQKKKIPLPATLGDAVRLVARLGGYLARANDPPPGHELMWQGFSTLQIMAEGFALRDN